jgi:hypothetical protein
MNVGQLIAILQAKDPATEVMLRDPRNDTGFVRAREADSLTLRAYFKKGMVSTVRGMVMKRTGQDLKQGGM